MSTDSRLRGEWLGSLRFDALSDPAWRVFTGALMWSNNHGTDGWVPERYVRQLHPDGERAAANEELVRAGLWDRENGGYRLRGWSDTSKDGLGQSTAAEVDAYRENSRRRQQVWREKQRAAKQEESAGTAVSGALPRDVTRYVPRDVGKARQGTEESNPPTQVARVRPPAPVSQGAWETAIPGQPGWVRLPDGSERELAAG